MHLRLLYKKFLCVFMSLMIVIFSTQSAYAVSSVGGWTAIDTITAGATNTINATKTVGGKVLNSAVTVGASASKVGKYLIKGGGQAAIAYAMVELADGALDWVLDPANNAVKYKPATLPDDYTCSGYKQVGGKELTGGSSLASCQLAVSPSTTGSSIISFPQSGSYPPRFGCRYTDSHPAAVLAVVECLNPTPNVDAGTDPDGYKSIPINTVAAKVIANAEAGHAPSQEAVKAVALEGFAAGENDAALDAAATEAGTQNPPDTQNPPTDTPVPFDPSSILAALSSISAILAGIMSALSGFVDWWQAQWTTFSTGITGFFEWVRAEPDTASLQPEPVEVSEGTLVDGWQDKANAGYVNLGGNSQCPSDVLIPISYMGASTNLSISYVPFCHFASIIRYAVIMGAWIAALMIISGGRTKE